MASEFARAWTSFALADFTTTCAKSVSFRLRTNAVGSFVFLSFFSPWLFVVSLCALLDVLRRLVGERLAAAQFCVKRTFEPHVFGLLASKGKKKGNDGHHQCCCCCFFPFLCCRFEVGYPSFLVGVPHPSSFSSVSGCVFLAPPLWGHCFANMHTGVVLLPIDVP
ncbi:hypothetical protein TcCL_Unassigned00690 [Trypanosoma cruzi]|nr:hypothetical protein TcCL_Unassigned00690 [Trypanosoma cruzi]